MAEKSKGFLTGAAMLAVVALVAKLIGAIYRIPLTNILGGEGIGLYQLAFPVYALILTLSGSSIPTCMARLLAEKIALNDKEGRDGLCMSSMAIMAAGGIAGAILIAALSFPLALAQGNRNLYIAYLILAPSVIFVAISGSIRGWYQGKYDMKPYSVMQLVEQIAKLVLGVALSWWLSRYGMLYAVIGAFAAVTLSELTGMLVMTAVYLRDADRPRLRSVRIDRKSLKEVVSISLPIVGNGLVIPIVTFIESIIIVRLLIWGGNDNNGAVTDYGMLTGVANTLINMPVVLAIAMSVMVVPIMARHKAERNADAVRDKADIGIKTAMTIGMPCFVVMSIMPRQIIGVLYPAINTAAAATASKLLALLGIQVLLLSAQQIYASVLQGLGFQSRVMKATLIGGIAKLLLDVILIPALGIIGAGVASIVGYGIIAWINTAQYNAVLGNKARYLQGIAKIFGCGAVMAAVVFAFTFIGGNVLSLFLAVFCGVVVFVFTVLITGAFSEHELAGIPLIGKIGARIKRIKHLK